MSNRRYIRKKRYKRVNTCAECGMCKTGMACQDARRELRSYNGARFTADGFDCALPVTIDSHSVCAYGCLYCFSDNLIQHRNNAGVSAQIGQTELKYIERIFAGAGDENSMENIIRQALNKYRKILRFNKFAYDCEHGDNKGGIVAMRTMDKEIQDCRAIERKWSRWVIKYPLYPKNKTDLLNGNVHVPIVGV